ncbi:MAG: hypothetical protein FD119_2827 [Stygiobacter sp.]|nr:MAG: hypothetical protein FD119_2827 [Stygiobacter sp.]
MHKNCADQFFDAALFQPVLKPQSVHFIRKQFPKLLLGRRVIVFGNQTNRYRGCDRPSLAWWAPTFAFLRLRLRHHSIKNRDVVIKILSLTTHIVPDAIIRRPPGPVEFGFPALEALAEPCPETHGNIFVFATLEIVTVRLKCAGFQFLQEPIRHVGSGTIIVKMDVSMGRDGLGETDLAHSFASVAISPTRAAAARKGSSSR